MKRTGLLSLTIGAVMSIPLVHAGLAQERQAPKVNIPQPGVPQVMTLEGTWVRAAYNNEGYAILGYRLANTSIGEEWMLLEFGITVRDGVPSQVLTREDLSLDTPDGKTIPIATVKAYREANLSALKNRSRVTRDSINYFPPSATRACRMGFFSDLDSPVMAWDEVELSDQRACLGQLYFQIPGGITFGQYWLNVKFEKSLVRVPFRILTKDEERLVSRNFGDIRKQVQDAFKPKPKPKN